MSFRKPLFWIKLTNYEYWNWLFFYLPLMPYWLYLAIKSRSLSYFTAVNPSIELGGFFGESKIGILNRISEHFLPKTIFIPQHSTLSFTLQTIESKGITFPIIAKPNIGERGNQVEKILTKDNLEKYINRINEDFIIQEFIEFPIELGVLYYRFPTQTKGFVSSVTLKEFLSVTGDGCSTILELLEQNDRARFQLPSLKLKLGNSVNEILAEGEKKLLEPIGNHCRGTKFVNANHLINEQLHEVFNTIANPIDGFFYGRFDMKVKSIEDLYQGKNIKIMELNGVSSEPGHIYDPSSTLTQAYKDLTWHWKLIADIAKENRSLGIPTAPFSVLCKETLAHFRA